MKLQVEIESFNS